MVLALVVVFSGLAATVTVVTLVGSVYTTRIDWAFSPAHDVVRVVVSPDESRSDIANVDVKPKSREQ